MAYQTAMDIQSQMPCEMSARAVKEKAMTTYSVIEERMDHGFAPTNPDLGGLKLLQSLLLHCSLGLRGLKLLGSETPYLLRFLVRRETFLSQYTGGYTVCGAMFQ